MYRTLKSKHLELLLIVTTVNYDLGNCKKRTFSLEAFAILKKIPLLPLGNLKQFEMLLLYFDMYGKTEFCKSRPTLYLGWLTNIFIYHLI